MLTLTTYRLTPYIPPGESFGSNTEPGSEWLRNTLNRLMVLHRPQLRQMGIDTSLFHNHSEISGATLTTYPLILYQHTGGQFLVSGLNAGAEALNALAQVCKGPVMVSSSLVVTLTKELQQKVEPTVGPQMINYVIGSYLAFDSRTFALYKAAKAASKIELLEATLRKHITNDLCKHLELKPLDIETEVYEITGITTVMVRQRSHLAFDISFGLNLSLPDYLALGHFKAFGYGVMKRGQGHPPVPKIEMM